MLLAVLLFGVENTMAQDTGPAARATALVRELSLDLRAIDETRSDAAHARARLREVLDQYFDLVALAEATVGAAFEAATPAEREAFIAAYGEYLIAIVLKRFAAHEGETLEIAGARELSVGRVRVVSRIVDARGRSKELDWLVGPGDPPRIDDMVFEGVRLRSQLHAEFSAVLERNNQRLGALIEAMARASAVDWQ